MAEIALIGTIPFGGMTRGLIPHHQRQRLRAEFGAELYAFRVQKGYGDKKGLRSFAKIARVSMSTLHDLEAGRRTNEYITFLTIYRIARRHGAEIVLSRTTYGIGDEASCEATTALEELWSIGIQPRFSNA